MAALKKEIKLFIVRSLAVFNTPTETVELVNQEYGVAVTKQQCEKYDPTKRAGENLSEELKKDFEKTREMFLGKPESIPIANLAVRLQRLENQYQKHSWLRRRKREIFFPITFSCNLFPATKKQNTNNCYRYLVYIILDTDFKICYI